jgi:hypothetical protein
VSLFLYRLSAFFLCGNGSSSGGHHIYKKIRLLLLRSTAAGRAEDLIRVGFLLEGVAWGSISGEIVRVVRA